MGEIRRFSPNPQLLNFLFYIEADLFKHNNHTLDHIQTDKYIYKLIIAVNG